MGGRRAPAALHAERVNAAVDLAGAGVPPAEAARMLAGQFAVSERQARRYVDQAVAGGRVPVPGAKVVFTVKLPAALLALTVSAWRTLRSTGCPGCSVSWPRR